MTRLFPITSCRRSLKADFHSVQNVARSTFSERFLLNYKQSSGTNLISCGWLHTFQKKALAKNRARDILHWMKIRLNCDNWDRQFRLHSVRKRRPKNHPVSRKCCPDRKVLSRIAPFKIQCRRVSIWRILSYILCVDFAIHHKRCFVTDLNYWIKLLSCIIEANGGHIGLSHINLHWYYWGSRRGFYRFRLLVGMDKHCVNEISFTNNFCFFLNLPVNNEWG